MSRSYPVGTTQVPFVLAVDHGGPVTGLTVKARILRPTDGFEWDFSDNTFKTPGSVVTPQFTLTESPTQPGLYLGVWNTTSIGLPVEADIIYQSTTIQSFIEDDQVVFSSQALSISIVDAFAEAVIDATQKTLTIVYGLKDVNTGVLATPACDIAVKDELENVLLTQHTVSTSGIHRAVFPNVKIAPNRVYILTMAFTFGLGTFNAAQPIKILGSV